MSKGQTNETDQGRSFHFYRHKEKNHQVIKFGLGMAHAVCLWEVLYIQQQGEVKVENTLLTDGCIGEDSGSCNLEPGTPGCTVPH